MDVRPCAELPGARWRQGPGCEERRGEESPGREARTISSRWHMCAMWCYWPRSALSRVAQLQTVWWYCIGNGTL